MKLRRGEVEVEVEVEGGGEEEHGVEVGAGFWEARRIARNSRMNRSKQSKFMRHPKKKFSLQWKWMNLLKNQSQEEDLEEDREEGREEDPEEDREAEVEGGRCEMGWCAATERAKIETEN